MATFNESITRLRRFLRDPDALIWDDDQIRIYFNDAQLELAQKIAYIERIGAYRYPPLYNWSYQWDWEIQHIDGDQYQCLNIWTTRAYVISYPWEAGYWFDSMSTHDDGTRFIHPWESLYCSPADVVKIKLHSKFNKMKFAAFDEGKIEPLSEKEISSDDPYYKTVTGEPSNYYRPDEYENDLVLYPRPTSSTWPTGTEGFDDAGGIVAYFLDSFDTTDLGLSIDVISTEDNLFLIFEAIPDEISDDDSDWDDEIEWWPPYMVPMIEYATLERCYGADTDGFIPSLRDYWETRKKVGIETIKVFKQGRLTDRNYRMGGTSRLAIKHPRLPAGYPAI